MDDSSNVKVGDDSSQSGVSVSVVSTDDVQPKAAEPIQSGADINHVGSAHKEVEPFPRASVESHITPTETQAELSDELKEIGVENSPEVEKPELSEEAKQSGVEHAKESVVVDPVAVPVIQLPPFTREEVLPHAQNGPVTDAARWFYTFLLRQIDKVKKQEL